MLRTKPPVENTNGKQFKKTTPELKSVQFLKIGQHFTIPICKICGKLLYANHCRAHIQITETVYCYDRRKNGGQEEPEKETIPIETPDTPVEEDKKKKKEEKEDPRIMFKRGTYIDISPNTQVLVLKG